MNKDITIADQANEVAHIALQKSGVAADYMLMNIAERGDKHALEVVRLLPPSAKSAIVREHDFTKPSLLGLLSEAKDVVDIMVGDPITWPNVNSMDEEGVKSFAEDITSIVTSLLLAKDGEEWLDSVFEEISNSEKATFFVAIAFIGCVSNDGESFCFGRAKSGDGTIEHVYRLMRASNDELTKRIGAIVAGYESWQYGSAIAIISDVYESTQQVVVSSIEGASDMFEDL
jgi:DNA integrity scanning protein DisA with diadenylate cyclase activity